MGIDLVIISAFLIATLTFGLSHSRGIKTFRDYALGGGMSTFVLTCSLVATLVQAQTFNGIACIYKNGFVQFSTYIILSFMTYLGVRVFIARMAEFLGDLSIAESMGRLYGPIVRSVTALAVLASMLCFVVTQLKVTLTVVHYALPDMPSNAANWFGFVVGIIVILYAALGGAKSVAMTDVFQFFCLGGAFPLIGYLLLRYAKIPFADGWVYLKQLPQFVDFNYILSPHELETSALFAAAASLTVFSPLVMQRFYMSKSIQQSQKIILTSATIRFCIRLSLLFLAVLLHLGGHMLTSTSDVIGYIIDLSASPTIRGIMGVTVLSLLMSTADSALHLISIVIVNDILPPSLFNGRKSEAKKLKMSRIIILVIGVISLCGALMYKGNIYKLILSVDRIYFPSICVPFAIAILGFKIRKSVVLIAMAVSSMHGVYAMHIDSCHYSFLLPSMVTSMIINIFLLVVGHYIAPKLPNTGWVGIKDPSAVDLQNQETKRWWMQQLCNFKMLFTKQYCIGLFPKKESTFVALGAYFIFSALLALCFMQKEYLFPYVYWYMAVMAIGTTLVIYPSFEVYKREPSFIYFMWPLVLFMLLFVSGIQFMKLGHYSPMLYALLVCNLGVSMLFLSLKVSMGMLMLAMMVHKFILPSMPFCYTYWLTLGQGPSWELMGAVGLSMGAVTGFGIYKYLDDKANVKSKVIELTRTYERRLSLEAIYNQVNWHRLDPTHGSKMLQEMSKMLEEPCHYLYANRQKKLGEDVNIFMKKLRGFSSLLLQRAKEERSLKLNEKEVKSIAIEPIVLKAYNDIRSLGEPMKLLLRNRTTVIKLDADPALFERLLTINLLSVSRSEQILGHVVTVTIADTTLRYDYRMASQLEIPIPCLSALAFCISTHTGPQEVFPVYDVTNEATFVFLPKTEAQLYQAESRQIIQAHGGYVEIIETKDRLTCLYVLPIAGKHVMHFKTYDPAALACEMAETPASLAQEKELVTLLTAATTLTKEMVEKTIAFIKNVHGLVKRKSGEPYYTHPMAVAKLLLDATKDPDTILAGLLHDVVEDTPVTLNQIQLMYGPQVAYIVDMVTHYNTNGYRWKLNDEENKSMLYQCRDIRVVYVKLADRLHNTRTLCFRTLVDQKRIARETMAFYIPWGKKNDISVWLSEMKYACEEILRKSIT